MAEQKECIFCNQDIIDKKRKNNEIVYESENFIAFPDISPVTEGHTLLIPKKHYENIIDLPSTLASEMLLAIKKIAEIKLKQGNKGFNTSINTGEAAGQVVMHLHIHLIPRKGGEKDLKLP